jgi:hypothetical protein
MKSIDKHMKNIVYGIASYLLIFLVFKLANITPDTPFWLITLLLLFIYFELWDLNDKK